MFLKHTLTDILYKQMVERILKNESFICSVTTSNYPIVCFLSMGLFGCCVIYIYIVYQKSLDRSEEAEEENALK